MTDFALIGAAGFVAPRHMEAIRAVGGNLVAAMDLSDSVGVLDRYFPEAQFFTSPERFDRFLEKRRRDGRGVDYVSICSPNHLHDAHVRQALRVGAHAICEKPLVISPWNLDALAALEKEYDRRVYTVLQLRLHPEVRALREKYLNYEGPPVKVDLTYVTRRGPWYHVSWKGDDERSGGVTMNIGIHLFDLLQWVFGNVQEVRVTSRDRSTSQGAVLLEKARVSWILSVDADRLPKEVVQQGGHAHRAIRVAGAEVNLSEGMGDLHRRAYEEVLAGHGCRIDDARPAVELVHQVQTSSLGAVALL